MNDFEELTSLTALLDDDSEAKPERSKARLKQAKSEKAKAQPSASKAKPSIVQAKQAKAKPRKRKRYTSTPIPNQIKAEPAGESAKVMTSIIISEDLRDWLKLRSLSTRLSMSQQIEILLRKEMKRLAKD